jgi:DNA-binding CsgD family transcriptional regulator
VEPSERFTNRELEVASMLADGYPSSRIAAALHLSPLTVQGYMKSLRVKTRRHTTTGAIAALLRDFVIR